MSLLSMTLPQAMQGAATLAVFRANCAVTKLQVQYANLLGAMGAIAAQDPAVAALHQGILAAVRNHTTDMAKTVDLLWPQLIGTQAARTGAVKRLQDNGTLPRLHQLIEQGFVPALEPAVAEGTDLLVLNVYMATAKTGSEQMMTNYKGLLSYLDSVLKWMITALDDMPADMQEPVSLEIRDCICLWAQLIRVMDVSGTGPSDVDAVGLVERVRKIAGHGTDTAAAVDIAFKLVGNCEQLPEAHRARLVDLVVESGKTCEQGLAELVRDPAFRDETVKLLMGGVLKFQPDILMAELDNAGVEVQSDGSVIVADPTPTLEMLEEMMKAANAEVVALTFNDPDGMLEAAKIAAGIARSAYEAALNQELAGEGLTPDPDEALPVLDKAEAACACCHGASCAQHDQPETINLGKVKL